MRTASPARVWLLFKRFKSSTIIIYSQLRFTVKSQAAPFAACRLPAVCLPRLLRAAAAAATATATAVCDSCSTMCALFFFFILLFIIECILFYYLKINYTPH